jgi:hypothetical protein
MRTEHCYQAQVGAILGAKTSQRVESSSLATLSDFTVLSSLMVSISVRAKKFAPLAIPPDARQPLFSPSLSVRFEPSSLSFFVISRRLFVFPLRKC